jgi:catalase
MHSIVLSMQGITGPTRKAIIARQLCHFSRADRQLGLGVATGLGMAVNGLLPTAVSRV